MCGLIIIISFVEVYFKVNKNVKKPLNNTYSEDKNKRLEGKLREKKDNARTNRIYNKVLKDIDIEELDDLDDLDDIEIELFEHKNKGKK